MTTPIRLLSLLLSALLLASLLGACSGSDTPAQPAGDSAGTAPDAGAPDQETPAPSDGEQVVLQYWHQGTNQEDVEEWAGFIASFNEKYPNITIEATGMTSTISEQETKLNAAVLSDTYPDVIHIVLAQVGSRGALDDFELLEPYIEAWADKDDIFDSAYEMGRFAGNQVALGSAPNPDMRVFRKDLFLEAGLDPDNPPATWVELMDAAVKLTQRDESGNVIVAGLDLPATDTSLVFTEPFMRSNGSLVVDEINQVPAFTDPGAIEAMEFIGELAALNIYIPHDFQNADEKPFMNLRGAIGSVGIGNITTFRNNHPELADEIGYLPILAKDENTPGVGFCGYQLYAMGVTSRHKDEAWLFIEHLMSAEVIQARTESRMFPPVRKSLEAAYVEEDSELHATAMEYVKNGKGKPTVPWVSIYNKYVSTAFEEVINGKKTAEQALQDAEAALLKEIEE